jgi:hypothetical protein
LLTVSISFYCYNRAESAKKSNENLMAAPEKASTLQLKQNEKGKQLQ